MAYYMEMRAHAIDLAWIFNINQTVGENIQPRPAVSMGNGAPASPFAEVEEFAGFLIG